MRNTTRGGEVQAALRRHDQDFTPLRHLQSREELACLEGPSSKPSYHREQ